LLRGGERDEELGLAAGLEPEAPRGAELDDLFDDVPLLVHLHGEDAPVDARIFVLGDRGGEALVQTPDAIAQDVGEPNEQRELEAASFEVVSEGVEIDAATFTRRIRTHFDVTLGVHREVGLAPATDLVEIRALLEGPCRRLVLAGTRRRLRSQVDTGVAEIRRGHARSIRIPRPLLERGHHLSPAYHIASAGRRDPFHADGPHSPRRLRNIARSASFRAVMAPRSSHGRARWGSPARRARSPRAAQKNGYDSSFSRDAIAKISSMAASGPASLSRAIARPSATTGVVFRA